MVRRKLSMKQFQIIRCSTDTSTNYNSSYSKSSALNELGNNISIEMVSALGNDDIQYDSGKYSIFIIANWFLSKEEMTHKKLQKLCYYAQAWCYALNNYRLISSDFQAWIHGPVSPALYDRFKCFGYQAIKIKKKSESNIESKDIELLEDVWDTYGDKTGNALEALSHRELPWLEARKGFATDERCSVVISPDNMKRYYKSIYLGE